MRFSLIMGTVGRTRELQRFLKSLNAQGHRDFGLIVVDQNTDDRLVPILEPYEDKLPITHIRERQRGASRARNIGIEYADADILGFPDDDCWYPPDLLEKIIRAFASHPEIDVVTGRLTDSSGRSVMGRFDSRPGRIDQSNVWTRGIEATTFLRKRCVEGLRFDENLGVGSGTVWGGGEVTDLLLTLLAEGKLLRYFPEIVIGHPPFTPRYDAEALQKAYYYGCGMGRVLRKHKTPLRLKAKWLIRPLGGTVLCIATLKPSKALYYVNTFRGRLRGILL